ncbi:nucleoside hydrolase [Pontibacter diazotrophicus]|uniref:Nucleoside hydrolase n=1 Tax=Pontibacter diazotrophicus TaxID=1400979 RepID=A0A3D8L3D5_9BACT|nr:nucleoside hydrolase [Pontibacter diazotrophicus]RDV11999.1 nucleoside hydrolase [Pontibacter diazotrophicus]
MKALLKLILLSGCMLLIYSCTNRTESSNEFEAKIPVIFDTDANNELDDQHALAYLLLNQDTFDVRGITVNATKNGGDIDEQYAEAERVLKLLKSDHKIPLLKGANGSFNDIMDHTANADFDGAEGVNFIIENAKQTPETLTVIAVGKLTNVALALKKDPSIANKLRVVWLGSNYPEPGEYNQDNDIPSMNYVLSTDVPFEMVTVRYGKPSGTDAVRVTPEEVKNRAAGKGPRTSEPVTGRHGGEFYTFGDYSLNLFEHITLHGNPPSRALFDMAAVAIVKNPNWAEAVTIPSPVLQEQENKWVEQPGNQRQIVVWQNFDKEKIIADYFASLEK